MIGKDPLGKNKGCEVGAFYLFSGLANGKNK